MHATYYTSGVVRNDDNVVVYMRIVITSTGLTLVSHSEVRLDRLRGVEPTDFYRNLPGAYWEADVDDELYTYDEEG